jgi:CDP-diacylglycerol--serine O-phosphatidyltransferase
MIGVYDYTVIATYLATVFGLWGMLQAIEGHPLAAIFCLLAAGLLDTVDGRIARTKKNRTSTEKGFGIQIDSLNDVMCFGALPALIAYVLGREWLGEVPVWYSATLIFFALTGLIRLAYFNVTEEERQRSSAEPRKYYLGLPITSSTLLFPLLYLLTILPQSGMTAAVLMAVGMFVVGVLYITPIHIRKPHLPGLVAMGVMGAAEVAVLIVTAVK